MFILIIKHMSENDITFLDLFIIKLKTHVIKIFKKRDISNNFNVLFIAQIWSNDYIH